MSECTERNKSGNEGLLTLLHQSASVAATSERERQDHSDGGLTRQRDNSLCLDNALEVSEQPQPSRLVRNRQERTGHIATKDERWRVLETRSVSSTCAIEFVGNSLMPLASKEMVARSEIGTCVKASNVNKRAQRSGGEPARNGSATHIPADFELVDAHEEDPDRGEDDDKRVVRRRQVEVRDVDLVEVLAVLDILEPVLAECLPLRVRLHDGESVR